MAHKKMTGRREKGNEHKEEKLLKLMVRERVNKKALKHTKMNGETRSDYHGLKNCIGTLE